MEYLYLLGGFILLILGAEIFIRGAVAIAQKLQISPLVIGLTVLALGTSTPELIVSLRAALNGSAGISIGNVVGSNISNVLLVLALTAIVNPVFCKRKEFIRDYSFLTIVSLIFALICLTGSFVRIYGIFMIVILTVFNVYNYINGKKKTEKPSKKIKQEEKNVEDALENNTLEIADLEISEISQKKWPFICFLTILGLGGVLWGADLLVKGAVILATKFNVSEEIIGLTVIAVGTSLPELATSIVAAFRNQNEMVLGNIIGSNIWNLLLIIGATSVIIPINVSEQIAKLDVWIMLASTMILLPLMIKNNKLGRTGGIILLIGYLAYIYDIYLRTVAA
ncbi:MAG: calcium/sodium antiporter [Alphaproteobacteria bacterium]